MWIRQSYTSSKHKSINFVMDCINLIISVSLQVIKFTKCFVLMKWSTPVTQCHKTVLTSLDLLLWPECWIHPVDLNAVSTINQKLLFSFSCSLNKVYCPIFTFTYLQINWTTNSKINSYNSPMIVLCTQLRRIQCTWLL